MRFSIITAFLLCLWLSSCIDPYHPEINGDVDGQLVIEGMITDQPGQQRVYLSTTNSFTDANQNLLKKVSGARVEISDDEGNVFVLEETLRPGVYATDPDVKGVIGRFYRLKVESGGKEYLSEPELLLPSAEPASVSAEFAHEFVKESSGETLQNKVLFYVNVSKKEEAAAHYKYSIEYTYEIEVPFWQTPFECGDTTKTEPTPQICYVQEQPPSFLNILSLENFTGSLFQKHLLADIDPDRKFMSKFSINVKQYSMTEMAYDYWEDIQGQALKTGSLFDPTPGRIFGNLYSVSDPDEPVFGYFMASSVKEKRSFFTPAVLKTEFDNFNDCSCFPELTLKCFNPLPTDTSSFKLPTPRATCCDCRVYPNSTVEEPLFWND